MELLLVSVGRWVVGGVDVAQTKGRQDVVEVVEPVAVEAEGQFGVELVVMRRRRTTGCWSVQGSCCEAVLGGVVLELTVIQN